MADSLSLLDGAAWLVDIDRLPARLVPTVKSRLRQFVDNGLLIADQEEGGRKGYKLNCEGMCLARLYLLLGDAHWDVPDLTKIRTEIAGFRGENPGPGMQGLSILMREVKEGRDKTLVLSLVSDASDGKKFWTVRLVDETSKKPGRASRSSDMLYENRAVLMTITIPLTPLFAPVIAAFSE